MSIVITGASGHIGRLVAGAALDRADPSEVVLVTRDPSRLADLADCGADIRAGDFDVPGSLAKRPITLHAACPRRSRRQPAAPPSVRS
jgi:uncharacterized protein YbjT (DUF2867 family)